jgi:hypothetical protein
VPKSMTGSPTAMTRGGFHEALDAPADRTGRASCGPFAPQRPAG